MEVQWREQTVYLKASSFSIEWIHSVEKEKWLEFYERRGSEWVLTQTRFKTFGAGVPSSGAPAGTKDGFVEYEVQRPLKELRLVVSPHVQSTLHLSNQRILLYNQIPPYEEVLMRPVDIPLYEYMIYLMTFHGNRSLGK